jgi:hypothetical protein
VNRILLAFLQVIFLAAAMPGLAFADEIVLPVDSAPIDDPLHGFCGASYSSSSCIDNGVITPFQSDALNGGFGFASDPGALSGTDWLVGILVPNNLAGADSGAFTVSNTAGTVPGNTAHNNVSATLRGLWTSGDLATFLGLSGSKPANPFNAFAVGVDTGVNGFFVYVADLGPMTLLNQTGSTAPAPPILTLGGTSLQYGTEITSFLLGATQTVATAPSSVLQNVPEPSTLLLFGLGIGLVGLTRYRLSATLASLSE